LLPLHDRPYPLAPKELIIMKDPNFFPLWPIVGTTRRHKQQATIRIVRQGLKEPPLKVEAAAKQPGLTTLENTGRKLGRSTKNGCQFDFVGLPPHS
jgi:hypothetical protein